MENFTWLLVSRMFIPLVEPVQPHNWEVFEWSPEFWVRMGSKPKVTASKATYRPQAAKPVLSVPPAQPVDHVKPLPTTDQAGQDEDAIGVFEL